MVLPSENFRFKVNSLWAREDELKGQQATLATELSALHSMVMDRETEAKGVAGDLRAVQREIEVSSTAVTARHLDWSLTVSPASGPCATQSSIAAIGAAFLDAANSTLKHRRESQASP